MVEIRGMHMRATYYSHQHGAFQMRYADLKAALETLYDQYRKGECELQQAFTRYCDISNRLLQHMRAHQADFAEHGKFLQNMLSAENKLVVDVRLLKEQLVKLEAARP